MKNEMVGKSLGKSDAGHGAASSSLGVWGRGGGRQSAVLEVPPHGHKAALWDEALVCVLGRQEVEGVFLVLVPLDPQVLLGVLVGGDGRGIVGGAVGGLGGLDDGEVLLDAGEEGGFGVNGGSVGDGFFEVGLAAGAGGSVGV